MSSEYREHLLRIIAKIEQLIAEAEAYRVHAAPWDDQVLIAATRQLTKLRRILAKVERLLTEN